MSLFLSNARFTISKHATVAAEPFAAAALARLEDWSELEGLVDPAAAADDDQLSENVLSTRFTAALHGITPQNAQVRASCTVTCEQHIEDAWRRRGCKAHQLHPIMLSQKILGTPTAVLASGSILHMAVTCCSQNCHKFAAYQVGLFTKF